MPSLDQVAEDAAAYVVREYLEPADAAACEITASEFAHELGYEPGLVSRAWKAADFDEYDVAVERIAREENVLRWEVSWVPGSDAVPAYPDREAGGGAESQIGRLRSRLGDYDISVERWSSLNPQFAPVYDAAIERLTEREHPREELARALANHEHLQERYDSLGERLTDAQQRLDELRDGVAEINETRKAMGEAVRTMLRME